MHEKLKEMVNYPIDVTKENMITEMDGFNEQKKR